MKKKLFVLGLMSCLIFGASPEAADIKAFNAPYNQALKTMEMKAEQKQMTAQTGAAMSQKLSSPEVIMIDPSTRAQDFKEAFTYLLQYKGGSPLFFELQDHEKLYNVLDLSLMKGGTMIIFKINTSQGLKYRVVNIEDIRSIGVD